MGRKIPGKKHKGVKDPEKQQAVRLKLIKDKINRAPTNPDEQPIPKSLEKIISLKKQASLQELKKKKGKVAASEDTPARIPKVHKPLKRLSTQKAPAKFSQLPGESDKAFLGRVHLTVREYLKETEFENKFGVDIKRDNETGQVTGVEKRPKDELEELIKKVKKNKKKKNNKNDIGEPRLTKTQKRSKKIADKKLKKELDRIDEFDKYTDNVKFGEIAHAPPTLSAPKKVSKTNVAPRPGQKDLLLKHISHSVPASVPLLKVPSKKSIEKVLIDKKGKRKELPAAVRRQLENVQSEVMRAYRNLKAQKN